MNNRKIPLRQCIGCSEMKDKRDMIRIIKTKEDEILLDVTGKKNGRGAYICCSSECFKRAVKNRGLERSLKTTIPKEIYDQIEKELIEIEAR